MTPKNKAEELFNRYYKKRSGIEHLRGIFKIIGLSKGESKEFALIAVDEIINSWKKGLDKIPPPVLKYWEEVKQEIENL